MGEIQWQRLASILFCLIGGGLIFYFGLRALFPLLLPFLIAWAVSLLIRPMATRLSRRTHLPQKACSVLLLVLLVGGVCFLIFVTVNRLLAELGHLLDRLLMDGGATEQMLDRTVAFLQSVCERFGIGRIWGEDPMGEGTRARLYEWISSLADRLFTSLASEIPHLVRALLAALPSVLLVSVVTAISGVYFCIDGERIMGSLTAYLPMGIRRRISGWKAGLRRMSWRYLRAYLFLTLLTFSELFLGFSILGIDYSFLLALLVALVDLLPVLGVGTVLLPWAAVLCLQRDFYHGVGLLILYAACLLLRQILEPRLVGRSLGLHPLLTLFASYAGWRLFGVGGMILAPIVAMLCKNLLQGREPAE